MSDDFKVPARYHGVILKWGLILFIPTLLLSLILEVLTFVWVNIVLIFAVLVIGFLFLEIKRMIYEDLRRYSPYVEEAMGDITPAQYQAVPRYAEEVLARRTTQATALSRLVLDVSLKERSAHDYLNFYLGLHRGICYERTVQISAIEYYMSIFDRLDQNKRSNALRSLGAYVSYYKRSQKVDKPRVEEVLLRWNRAWET